MPIIILLRLGKSNRNRTEHHTLVSLSIFDTDTQNNTKCPAAVFVLGLKTELS